MCVFLGSKFAWLALFAVYFVLLMLFVFLWAFRFSSWFLQWVFNSGQGSLNLLIFFLTILVGCDFVFFGGCFCSVWTAVWSPYVVATSNSTSWVHCQVLVFGAMFFFFLELKWPFDFFSFSYLNLLGCLLIILGHLLLDYFISKHFCLII